MRNDVKMAIHNRFDIEVVNAATGETKKRAQAFNVICDTLYTYLCSLNYADGYGRQVVIGSGAGTPAHTDTVLFNKIGSKAIGGGTVVHDYDHNIIRITKYVQLTDTEFVNQTITEIGLSYDGTHTSTHAMLQDMNGNPISILKTNTDIINIYATIFVHYSNGSNGLRFWGTNITESTSGQSWRGGNILGMLAGFSGRLYAGTNYTYLSNVFEGNADFSSGSLSSGNQGMTGDVQNKAIKIDFKRLPVTDGNYEVNNTSSSGLVRGIIPSVPDYFRISLGTGGVGISFSVAEPRNIVAETIGTGDGTTTKYRTLHGSPYNARVYINGVETNNVTVLKATPTTNYTYHYGSTDRYRWMPYFKEIRKAGNEFVYAWAIGEGRDLNAITTWENLLAPLSKGITSWVGDVSDDFEHWTAVSGTLTEAQKNSKYYRGKVSDNLYAVTDYDGCNVIFDTPPAAGDVITIDYTTDTIPKDSDHVLDVSITLTFGEWTGE